MTAGRVYSDPVELVDVFPTLVELLALPPLAACPVPSFSVDTCTEGRSRAALILNNNVSKPTPVGDDNNNDDNNNDDDDDDEDKIAYSQGDFSRPVAREFYLLGRDPGEDRNLAGAAGYGGGKGGPLGEVEEVDLEEVEVVEEEEVMVVKHTGAMKRLAARVARKFGAVN
ncbi:unnamed protein product [Lampetra planeri]